MSYIIQATNLRKQYGTNKEPIVVLDNVSFNIEKGSFTIILGRSGSGKSTLLNLITGLDKSNGGQLTVDGFNLSKASHNDLAKYRSNIGIIFQSYNLLPSLTTIENVLIGAWAGNKKATKEEAKAILDKFELSHRLNTKVTNLSGGEKQRVAIARSLISNPNILFCDEPTGALDSSNGETVKNILKQLHNQGLTVVMVTHDEDFQSLASQVIRMKDGKIISIEQK
jgi:putative ABC transport system ATP-binding protein